MSTKISARQVISRDTLTQIANAAGVELDNLIRSIDEDLVVPLRLSASSPADMTVSVGASVVTNSETDRVKAAPFIKNTIVPFTSGTITFPSSNGGTITVTPGDDVTLVCPDNEYIKVLIALNAEGNLVIVQGDSNANPANALVPRAPRNTLAIGYIELYNNLGIIEVVEQSQIFQFGSGAGSGGAGVEDFSIESVKVTGETVISGGFLMDSDGVEYATHNGEFDSQDWSTSDTVQDNSWKSIAYSPELDLFVAVAESGTNRVITSSDGQTWTVRSAASADSWTSVIWAKELGLFVAVGYSGSFDGEIMTSPDGINWTARTAPTGVFFRDVSYSPELNLLVAANINSNSLVISNDAITWIEISAPISTSAIAWSSELGLFVATGTTSVITSSDGINWSIHAAISANVWNSIIWAKELGLFVAVGEDGSGSKIMTSPDGISWTARTAPPSNLELTDVVWSEDFGLLVATAQGGTGNRIATSTDGITWTSGTSAADNSWNSIAYSSRLGVFVAVASSGTDNRAMVGTTNFVDANFGENLGLDLDDLISSPTDDTSYYISINKDIANLQIISSDSGRKIIPIRAYHLVAHEETASEIDRTRNIPIGLVRRETAAWSKDFLHTLAVRQHQKFNIKDVYQTIVNNRSIATDIRNLIIDKNDHQGFKAEYLVSRLHAEDGIENADYYNNTIEGTNNPNGGADGNIYAIDGYDDGVAIVGGAFSDDSFNEYGLNGNHGYSKLNNDGSESVTFTGGTISSANEVYAIAIQEDGKIIVGGEFLFDNKTNTRNRLDRVNSDGSVDSSFYTNLGTAVDNNSVRALALQSDDKILVGGDFTSFNGNTRNSLFRLNSDGTEDSAFYTNLGTGFNGLVEEIVIQEDGKILVGGDFSSFNGNTRNYLVRLNSDGTEDTSFYTNLGTGFNNVIDALAVQEDGKILVGGFFNSFNSNTRNKLVRLNSDGTEDSAFYTNLGSAFDNSINVIRVQPNGRILIGGPFITFNGNTRNGLVRLHATGIEDADYYTNLGTGFNGAVNDIYIKSNHEAIVVGNFTQLDGNTRNRIALISADFTELVKQGTLRGIYKPNSATWELGGEVSIGDDAGVEFEITSSGQLQYTSTNISGAILESFIKIHLLKL